MDLAEAVDTLYGVPPTDFVAARSALVARATQDAPDLVPELRALRKPTVVAWLLNRVVRDAPEVVTTLLELGERMRSAQAKGDGEALARARPERQAAIESLVDAARACAQACGTRFGVGAVDGVTSTAVAALADPASGGALRSGRLLRPLAYAGFGEVELDDAVAVLRLVPPLAERADDETGEASPAGDGAADAEARAAREHELAGARDELREQERRLSAARLAHSEARSALEEAAEEVRRLEGQVAAATEHVTALETRPTGGHA